MNRKSHLRNSFSLMKTCYNEMRQNVPGEDKALEVAEKENIPVYLIMKTEQGFETKMSSAFQKLLANKE